MLCLLARLLHTRLFQMFLYLTLRTTSYTVSSTKIFHKWVHFTTRHILHVGTFISVPIILHLCLFSFLCDIVYRDIYREIAKKFIRVSILCAFYDFFASCFKRHWCAVSDVMSIQLSGNFSSNKEHMLLPSVTLP